ncbi:MAG: SPFH domain-containing protein [Methylococcaceae bacterium]|nr:SPFH domain-containing protein [Methylococcaceae bacterium]MDZ4156757.1 SPFH domain-containing protein [Methylococcales bacterium]MDP2393339.1 SPFH domain-containing protein [Methylococcaceae bacterium]MDP3018340.1 SPFH domain-containing protein [Methylococcaceae bacterium]MDP3388558.1 SPFH domain-containing protein [Methylococcaceae bacterium]
MALLNTLKRQFRSVIEWQNPHPDALFQQWTDNGDEIKNASTLIVGPGQGCIFVYQGKVQAVIEKQCLINLATDNIPFWTTISKFMQFFESEHKVGIYFFKTSQILDQKWGTTSVIKYQDPKYQFPVGLKLFGNYSYRIAEPKDFFVNVVGSHNDFFIDDFRAIMSARIIHPLADFLATSRYSYAEIDANREEIALGLKVKLSIAFQALGFDITDFRIEGTDFDDDTLKRVNRIADLTAETQAAQAAGVDYAKLQHLEAMREAARNEGGGAGIGLGMGAGIGFGQQMAQTLTEPAAGAQPVANDTVAKLTELKHLFTAELISADEYAAKKKAILDSL